MNLLLLIVSVAIGAALGYGCVAGLWRIYQRTRSLRCIVPNVPAAQRSAP